MFRCGNNRHQSGDRECSLKDVIMPNEESRLKRDDPLTAIMAQTDSSEEEGCNMIANSLHPGIIVTNKARYVATNSVLISILSVAKPFLKSIPQGAATTCYLALHPDAKGVSGKYFADCNEATPTTVARNAGLARGYGRSVRNSKIYQHDGQS